MFGTTSYYDIRFTCVGFFLEELELHVRYVLFKGIGLSFYLSGEKPDSRNFVILLEAFLVYILLGSNDLQEIAVVKRDIKTLGKVFCNCVSTGTVLTADGYDDLFVHMSSPLVYPRREYQKYLT